MSEKTSPEVSGSSWYDAGYRNLLIDNVTRQFPNLDRTGCNQIGYDLGGLISYASMIARSENQVDEERALRIAQHALRSDRTEMRLAACIVMDQLSNKQAIDLARAKGLIGEDIPGDLPTPLKLDWYRRRITNSVVVADETVLELNRFQKKLWGELESNKWVSVSAPTSSGKSFLLSRWLVSRLDDSSEPCVVVFLVPTRALIYQIENELTEYTRQLGLNIRITSVPATDQYDPTCHTIFVFTQERLQIMQGILNRFPVDFLVVDEAQKVGDGERGILLHQTLEKVTQDNSKVIGIFSSPLTENPGLVLDLFGKGDNDNGTISHHVTVNQNLIWLSQIKRKPKEWAANLCLDGDLVNLGKINLSAKPDTKPKRAAFLAHALAHGAGGTIIYANRPSDAEETATVLADLLACEEHEPPQEIMDLIDLVKKTIHPDYSLAATLEAKVAFHYGNMPLLIKAEIEKLFKSGDIKFLVCTSTLVEGVNLPCRSIFIYGPRKGVGKPMSDADFWNLAGRAGRLGKEFQGNIFCIDPEDDASWITSAPKQRGTFRIQSAAKDTLSEFDKFSTFLDTKCPRDMAIESPKFDQMTTLLIAQHHRLSSFQDNAVLAELSIQQRQKLEHQIGKIIEDLEVPIEIVINNPGISPYGMNSLNAYFSTYEKDLENLIPSDPSERDSGESYLRTLQRINTHFGQVFFPPHANAILIVNWMKGHPLKRLISDRIKRITGKSKAANIRETMSDVENIARFLAPKYIGCYTDVLKYFLKSNGHLQLLSAVPETRVWLEFGASSETQISLMKLGLSRTSAVEVSQIMALDNLDEKAVIKWLARQNFASLDLPALVVAEIKSLLTKVSQTIS